MPRYELVGLLFLKNRENGRQILECNSGLNGLMSGPPDICLLRQVSSPPLAAREGLFEWCNSRPHLLSHTVCLLQPLQCLKRTQWRGLRTTSGFLQRSSTFSERDPQIHHIWTEDPQFVWLHSTDKSCENRRSTSSKRLATQACYIIWPMFLAWFVYYFWSSNGYFLSGS